MAPSVHADLPRRPVEGTAPVAELVDGLRGFALRLASTQPATENLVVSPVSMALAFAMVEAGAAPPTAAAIADVFGFPAEPGVHEALNALSSRLADVEVTLDIANAIWAQVGLDVGAGFLATLAAHYGAGVEVVDYASDAEAARREINAWVAGVTRERIPELVPPGTIDGDTLVAVVNAVYLDAAWLQPFDPAHTAGRPFTLVDGNRVEVPTMRHPRLHTLVAHTEAWTAVQLSYDDTALAMVVMVPAAGRPLAELEPNLTGGELGDVVEALRPGAVDLSLPRWDTASSLDLAPPLSALGLRIPGGDLGGIAPGALIGAAVHAATITVDEARTVASAATGVVAARAAFVEPVEVVVDRPFLFLVQHRPTGAPLFYGRVTDPRR